MRDQAAAATRWRHQERRNDVDFVSLIHSATLAASSHNTQPWHFRPESRAISILPDMSRRLSAVDPDDHHLFASLGCAAENLLQVLYSEADDPAHWIEAGRSYQRLALQATAMELRNGFIHQPVEVAHLRSQLAAWLGIGDRRADLLVRIGRGPGMPRTLRRPVADVIINANRRDPDRWPE